LLCELLLHSVKNQRWEQMWIITMRHVHISLGFPDAGCISKHPGHLAFQRRVPPTFRGNNPPNKSGTCIGQPDPVVGEAIPTFWQGYTSPSNLCAGQPLPLRSSFMVPAAPDVSTLSSKPLLPYRTSVSAHEVVAYSSMPPPV
jgi:hypothetical protein